MRWLALALVVTGCLDEPGPPIGHRYEMRDAVLVADLDGDGKDDLVTWGHAGDPRKTSEVFIRWGMGMHHLDEQPDITISISGFVPSVYHEVLAVAFASFQSARELLVLTTDDDDLPPNGGIDRKLQLWHVSITDHMVGAAKSSFTAPLAAYRLGGYTRAPDVIFLAPYQPPIGAPRVLVGNSGRVLDGPLSGDLTDITLGLNPNEVLQAVVPVPPGASSTQDVLFITTKRVVKGQPGASLPAGTQLPSRNALVASVRDIGGVAWIAAVEPNAADISIIKINDNDSPVEVYDTMPGPTPTALAVAALDYATSSLGLVTLDASGVTVLHGLDTATPSVGFDLTRGPVAAGSKTVLAVGNWDSTDDSVMVFDATDKTDAPLCRYYAADSTLDGC